MRASMVLSGPPSPSNTVSGRIVIRRVLSWSGASQRNRPILGGLFSDDDNEPRVVFIALFMVVGVLLLAAPFRTGDRIQTSVFTRELVKAVELEQQAERGLESLRERPALLLWGTKDFAFNDTDRRRFEDAFVNHRTVLLDASHFWQEDQPDIAVHEIRQWLGDRV